MLCDSYIRKNFHVGFNDLPSKIKILAKIVTEIVDREGYAEVVNDISTSTIICRKTYYFYHTIKKANLWLLILCEEMVLCL